MKKKQQEKQNNLLVEQSQTNQSTYAFSPLYRVLLKTFVGKHLPWESRGKLDGSFGGSLRTMYSLSALERLFHVAGSL